jgi:hypothetical protein
MHYDGHFYGHLLSEQVSPARIPKKAIFAGIAAFRKWGYNCGLYRILAREDLFAASSDYVLGNIHGKYRTSA